MNIVMTVAIVLLCGVVYAQSKQLDIEHTANLHLINICEELHKNQEALERRMYKVEQIAANAQNKATVLSHRIDKGVVYESEH